MVVITSTLPSSDDIFEMNQTLIFFFSFRLRRHYACAALPADSSSDFRRTNFS